MADKIYDLLVEIGGASEDERESFVLNMTSEKRTDEWRFQGNFGFGGKYWPLKNHVTYYPEYETEEREKLVGSLNGKLQELFNGQLSHE